MSTQTLAQKLLGVQKRIGSLTKDMNNPFFKSKYADLNQVLALAKEHLHPLNLFILQGPGVGEHGRYIETSIIDADSGQQVNCKVPFSGNEKNMQEIGAATTYGRRFGIVSLLALEQDDDDGESAVGRAPVTKTVKKEGGPTESPKTATKTKPVQKEVPTSFNRKATLEKISLTSKVIIDSKRDTHANILKLLNSYGVTTKEELTDDQAAKLLTQLNEVLNAK